MALWGARAKLNLIELHPQNSNYYRLALFEQRWGHSYGNSPLGMERLMVDVKVNVQLNFCHL